MYSATPNYRKQIVSNEWKLTKNNIFEQNSQKQYAVQQFQYE